MTINGAVQVIAREASNHGYTIFSLAYNKGAENEVEFSLFNIHHGDIVNFTIHKPYMQRRDLKDLTAYIGSVLDDRK